MAYFTYISLAVFCAIAVAVCGANRQPRTIEDRSITNVDADDNSVKIAPWPRSAISSLKLTFLEDTPAENTEKGLHSNIKQEQNKTSQVNEQDSALPVLIHKKHESSGIQISPSPASGMDRVNPFFRTKRSTCQFPANLIKIVKYFKTRLNVSQIVGLNPEESPRKPVPADQPNTCPSNTSKSWQEVNLKSTCPWKIHEHDLGEDAFPRYINNATCLCLLGCIGSPSQRCEEIKQDVTYLYRQGCQDEVAIMNTRIVTIVVGCHCVTPPESSLLNGPITP